MAVALPKFCRSLTKFAALRSQAGFSILEVIVAAVVVAIAAIGLSVMYSTGQALVQAQGSNRAALQLAQQRIEQIRAGGFGPQALPDLREETTFAGIPNNPGYERTTIITGVCPNDFTVTWANSGDCSPALPTVEAKRVVVTVRANNGQVGGTLDPQTQPAVLQLILVRR
ncbi:MAG TPA: prepilin-type N-terminal cleavage/methylation domain-containing protein [Methylomirabilota bacterium]|nr:prepilin-type N-terminal cleavage/methylation domain-containing protein [Methylomirabilota bacterium]